MILTIPALSGQLKLELSHCRVSSAYDRRIVNMLLIFQEQQWSITNLFTLYVRGWHASG